MKTMAADATLLAVIATSTAHNVANYCEITGVTTNHRKLLLSNTQSRKFSNKNSTKQTYVHTAESKQLLFSVGKSANQTFKTFFTTINHPTVVTSHLSTPSLP